MKLKKETLLPWIAVAVMAIIALCFFLPDVAEGRVLQQHDIQQGLANGQEVKAYEAATGETSRWTNALFSGMPNFQIAPSYTSNSLMGWIQTVYTLGLPSPANLLFAMMLGFFIMCLCFRIKWPTALFASIAWGFSTYFVIIIGAGHIWKFVTLAYIPPTIGGLALLYRGKYLSGTALTALFASMQLMSNHPQMTYYFLLPTFCLVVAWGVIAYREKLMKRWVIATLLACCAGGLAVAVNSASLYNSYEYSRETVRGKATDIADPNAVGDNAGMAHDAITAWSYGLDETFTLLIPNVKGGATIKPVGGANQLLSVADTPTVANAYLSPEEVQFLGQFPQYFGDQPMTNGPVYVGAFVLLLAVLALFVVDGPKYGPIKWALFISSALAIALAWGHNFPVLTDFFIDNFPGYNKFRAVASILVIPEFCIPLLACLCLKKMMDTPDFLKVYKWQMITVFGLGALICFIGWVSPSVFGSPFSISETRQLTEMGVLHDPAYASIFAMVREARLNLVGSDSLRSLIFILLGWGVTWLYLRKAFTQKWLFITALTGIVLIDLFSVNKRYVDTANFTEPLPAEEKFEMTAGDRQILQDKDPNYRVLDLKDFSGARSSYFHKTIGGYHAAKLTRYDDLIKYGIQPAMQRLVDSIQVEGYHEPVLDMLNTRYYMYGDLVVRNPEAAGNAWWIDNITYVDTPRDEMAALGGINPKRQGVADKKFAGVLGTPAAVMPGDTIYETEYAPNRLTYRYKSARGGVAVFSEIYFPWGWEAEVDGSPVEIGRADYTLRAMRLPAGEHELVMTFNPESLEVTNAIGVGAVVVLYLLLISSFVIYLRKYFAKKD